ncbi:MAG: hypothetical protein RL754_533 [Bacteroidota bacterium]|jgi:S-adenosylmethionine hydrolase
MALITATSDFGRKDATLAELKAQCYSRINDLNWVDISHEIEPHNIWQSAFVLRRVYKDFPAGTVHMMFVGAAPREGIEYLVIKADGQFFIAPNNGVLAYVLRDAKIAAARSIVIPNIDLDQHFALFAAAASHLIGGGKIDLLGPPLNSIVKIKEGAPAPSERSIQGAIVYVDHYGTCITNITKALFNSHLQGRRFSVELPRTKSIGRIYDRLGDVPQGTLAAYWDRHGHLSVLIGKSGGSHLKGSNELLGLKVNDWVRIDFV